MTWQMKDCLPKQERTKAMHPAEPLSAQSGAQHGEAGAPQEPEAIPTFAQEYAYSLESEEDVPQRFTREQERELAFEGFWPQREWDIWGRWLTRGIIPQ